MKTIKTLLLVGMTPFLLTTLNSCTDYQDEIDALDVRVTYLESLVKIVNSDLAAIKTITDALKDADYITNVTKNTAGDWVINFHKYGPIVIHNGLDATMPSITVVQDPTDGNYYWQLDGVWLTTDGTPSGPRVKANGTDGKDGQDGKDGKDGVDGQNGKDGIDGQNGRDGVDGKDGQNGKDGAPGVSPLVRIADGFWEISTDGGVTWIRTTTPAQGKDGKDGKDGQDASPIVDVRTYWTEGGGYVEFIFANGTGNFTVPLYPTGNNQ